MGLAERKEREKEQRKNDILDAAEKIFFSKGVESSTMDEVAELAELSKGTLYLYFKNKNDLFHGIVVRGLETLYAMFKEAVEKGKTGIDQVKAIGQAYYRFYKEEPDYFSALLHHESIEVTPETLAENPCICQCRDLGNAIFTLIQEAVSNGLKDGSIKKGMDTFKLPLVLWGLTAGVLHIYKSKEKEIEISFGISIDELWEYSFKLIGDMLKNEN
jgi:TetR/AcrR family transcriptional regulator